MSNSRLCATGRNSTGNLSSHYDSNGTLQRLTTWQSLASPHVRFPCENGPLSSSGMAGPSPAHSTPTSRQRRVHQSISSCLDSSYTLIDPNYCRLATIGQPPVAAHRPFSLCNQSKNEVPRASLDNHGYIPAPSLAHARVRPVRTRSSMPRNESSNNTEKQESGLSARAGGRGRMHRVLSFSEGSPNGIVWRQIDSSSERCGHSTVRTSKDRTSRPK